MNTAPPLAPLVAASLALCLARARRPRSSGPGAPRQPSQRAGALLADLDDGDNHLELCVEVGLIPSRLVVEAGTAFDPTNNPNPPTSIAILAR